MNYYERHIGDYLKDTAHLSLLEHGVYTRLMDVYYTREGGIPTADAARLIGARSRDEKAALQAVLGEFFELVDGAHRQQRCDREIERYKDKQAKAKRSAEARWSQGKLESDGNANASSYEDADGMRSHTEGNAPRARPQTPVTSNQTPDNPHSPPEGGDAPPAKRKRTKAEEVTLAQWLATEKAAGRKAIPPNDAVFGYARDIGLPDEFLSLAWHEFRSRYTAEPVKGQRQKTYTDWRAVFRKAVKEGWLKLWFLDGQQYALTTSGQQAQRAMQAQQRETEPA